MKLIVSALGLALLSLGSLACSKRAGAPAPRGSAVDLSAAKELGFHYPAARWRLAMFDQLDRATLWVGHIAIRHDHSQLDLFRPPGWRPDSPNPPRTVAQAFALAQQLRAQIAAAPAEFERLARLHSDDVVSKEDGGLLGGVRASQLADKDFLDALATLRPGEVSQPFETPYGFHIVKRYPPPAEERVAGQRIVIGYQGVFGLQHESQRTRAQAQQLATEIASRAKNDPETFDALVDQNSDNVDRAIHGDMGVYSTRDPGYVPVEVHRLANVKVGEVTGPIDSRFGFEILKRVVARPRTEYAMTAIEVTSSDASSADEARAQALKSALEVTRALQVAPGRFEELQRKSCCERIRRWSSGRGDLELTKALDRVSIGQIADEPVMFGHAYLVMKRLDPSKVPPEAPLQWEVPNPSDPDYDAIARTSDGSQLAAAARSFMQDARAGARLSAEAAQTTAKTIDHLAAYLEQNGGDHQTVHSTIVAALGALQSELGSEQFGRLEAFGRRWIIRQMMPPGSAD